LISALAVANTESTASSPRTKLLFDTIYQKFVGFFPRLKSWGFSLILYKFLARPEYASDRGYTGAGHVATGPGWEFLLSSAYRSSSATD
jgi:hypothetical protein